jgi:predicted amidohydrolase
MRIALAQLDATLGDVEANGARVRETIAATEADVVVFPELYLSGYALSDVESDTTATADEVASLVPSDRAALVGFHERGGRNSAVYVDGGRAVHVQRKVALVDYAPFDEHLLFEPGDELAAFDTSHGRLATLICNDAWQPALAALAVDDGAEVLLMPACSSTEVPEAEETWRDLTRLYARLLGCHVVFVNRVGTEPALEFWGGSHVVDPRGTVIAEAPRFAEAVLVAEIDLAGELTTPRRNRFNLLKSLGVSGKTDLRAFAQQA